MGKPPVKWKKIPRLALANKGKANEDNLDHGIKGLATFRGKQRKQTHISSGKKWPQAQAPWYTTQRSRDQTGK